MLTFATPKRFLGSLAQLVQSVCLTSRGSGVRIPQLPHRKPFTKVRGFFRISIFHPSVFILPRHRHRINAGPYKTSRQQSAFSTPARYTPSPSRPPVTDIASLPGHVKHQGSKGTLFSKIHIAHTKKTGETSLTDLTEFRTGHDRRMYHTTTADGDKATKKTSADCGGLGVGLPRFELGMTGPESVVLPLHHSPMICSCRKDDAKVELNFLSAKKNRCFFTFSLSTAPKSTSDAPERPPPPAYGHTVTLRVRSAIQSPRR